MQKESSVRKFFRIILGLMLVYAGTSHLLWNRTEFLAQVPPWLPFNKDLVVIISGVLEMLLGLGLLFLSRYRTSMGWLTALFFILIFPGNISQFVNHVDGFGLNTDSARGLRLIFQPLLVIWALSSTGAWSKWRNRKTK